ncbi:hypothetical protein L249_6576 [Ophiocordyceps polyrhachis-furcata BCC 54312]|uniref:Uncharacterized protein n=1 Tax=Ophiocordyceps polyrhachis-furcata BCC 54312 TaxID=1330021 RepID=A0A367LKF5_9HYPO|nr:hypothetical protein L249_6576 [Ophiocordyceps polyrhachis-furcata BCC 54312]
MTARHVFHRQPYRPPPFNQLMSSSTAFYPVPDLQKRRAGARNLHVGSKLLCVTTRGQKGTKTQIKSHPPPYLVLLARDAKPMRRLS